MLHSLLPILAAALLLAQQPPPPQPQPDWRSMTNLPGVDMRGLTPAQQAKALKILREEGCVCGCTMKLAECRVLDPPCTDSQGLAKLTVEQVKAGKTPEQIHKILEASPIAQARIAKFVLDPSLPQRGAIAGNPKITLVEFSDFQCPYCATAAGKLTKLVAEYPKDVRLVFKQFPLESHAQAGLAAQAALAAHAQGKFWELHDKMFANFRRLSRENILTWARELGLDAQRLAADIDSGKYRQQVQSEFQEGLKAGVSGTPTLFINGKRWAGPIEPEYLKPYLDAEIRK